MFLLLQEKVFEMLVRNSCVAYGLMYNQLFILFHEKLVKIKSFVCMQFFKL